MPAELEAAGIEGAYRQAVESSREEYERLRAENLEWAAPYALCMAFRTRYVLDMTAREALHVIELRSGKQGHLTYRVIAQEMHARIEEHHPSVAKAMQFVDHSPPDSLHRAVSRLDEAGQMDFEIVGLDAAAGTSRLSAAGLSRAQLPSVPLGPDLGDEEQDDVEGDDDGDDAEDEDAEGLADRVPDRRGRVGRPLSVTWSSRRS